MSKNNIVSLEIIIKIHFTIMMEIGVKKKQIKEEINNKIKYK
jgi:hypothetical protein